LGFSQALKIIFANRHAAAQKRLVAAAHAMLCGTRRAAFAQSPSWLKIYPVHVRTRKALGLMTRKLVLCAGGTSTGKTTLVNALLAEFA
jgi:type IV secretory pathway ATPase VirB11/archaellum biosynthesis ATPase